MSDESNLHDEARRAFVRRQIALWDLARAVLLNRPGWHFEPDDGMGLPFWKFGELGAARLVLTVHYDQFWMYDADNDKDHPIAGDAGMLTFWLDKHEPEHTGLTEQQLHLSGEVIPLELEEWMREHPESGG